MEGARDGVGGDEHRGRRLARRARGGGARLCPRSREADRHPRRQLLPRRQLSGGAPPRGCAVSARRRSSGRGEVGADVGGGGGGGADADEDDPDRPRRRVRRGGLVVEARVLRARRRPHRRHRDGGRRRAQHAPRPPLPPPPLRRRPQRAWRRAACGWRRRQPRRRVAGRVARGDQPPLGRGHPQIRPEALHEELERDGRGAEDERAGGAAPQTHRRRPRLIPRLTTISPASLLSSESSCATRRRRSTR